MLFSPGALISTHDLSAEDGSSDKNLFVKSIQMHSQNWNENPVVFLCSVQFFLACEKLLHKESKTAFLFCFRRGQMYELPPVRSKSDHFVDVACPILVLVFPFVMLCCVFKRICSPTGWDDCRYENVQRRGKWFIQRTKLYSGWRTLHTCRIVGLQSGTHGRKVNWSRTYFFSFLQQSGLPA